MILSWASSCSCNRMWLADCERVGKCHVQARSYDLQNKKSRGRAISSYFGTHLIPNLPHQNECDDADKCALRRLYPSEIAQNDNDHHRELPR